MPPSITPDSRAAGAHVDTFSCASCVFAYISSGFRLNTFAAVLFALVPCGLYAAIKLPCHRRLQVCWSCSNSNPVPYKPTFSLLSPRLTHSSCFWKIHCRSIECLWERPKWSSCDASRSSPDCHSDPATNPHRVQRRNLDGLCCHCCRRHHLRKSAPTIRCCNKLC